MRGADMALLKWWAKGIMRMDVPGLTMMKLFSTEPFHACGQVLVRQERGMDRARMNGLMDRACMGDAVAFEGVAGTAQDELFRLAMALGLGREDAAEATQETLMRAYADRGSWRRGGDAMGWLCGIAVN